MGLKEKTHVEEIKHAIIGKVGDWVLIRKALEECGNIKEVQISISVQVCWIRVVINPRAHFVGLVQRNQG